MRLAIALLFSVWFGFAWPVAAQNDQTELLDRARIVFESIRSDKDLGPGFNTVFSNAKAVLIVPSLLKGGFIVGGEGGNGVLLARLDSGGWSAPAFVFVGGASVGLQIGGSVSEVIFTIMTEKGLDAILVNKVKLGADASVAIGPVGGRVGAATTTSAGADIYTYATSEGLFAGGALEGAIVTRKESWDRALYGTEMTARRIITDPGLAPPAANALREALAQP